MYSYDSSIEHVERHMYQYNYENLNTFDLTVMNLGHLCKRRKYDKCSLVLRTAQHDSLGGYLMTGLNGGPCSPMSVPDLSTSLVMRFYRCLNMNCLDRSNDQNAKCSRLIFTYLGHAIRKRKMKISSPQYNW